MGPPRVRNPLPDREARAIAQAWLTPSLDATQSHTAAAAVTAPALAAGDPRPRLLSRAFESVRCATLTRREPGAPELVDTVLSELRAAGWPRALRLAEAAWVLFHTNEPAHAAQSLVLLRAHAEADRSEPRPDAEVFWSEVAHCGLAGDGLPYGDALSAGLRADAHARAAGLDLMRVQAAQSLAFVFLSVGDVEGACAVLPEAIELIDRARVPQSLALLYNLMLGLMLGRRTEDADALLHAHPQLQAARSRPGPGACVP